MVAQLPHSFFFVPYILSSKRATLQATGHLWLIHVYSVWSLAWSLATLCGVLFVSCISGGHASDWLLATGSNAFVLVACMVACVCFIVYCICYIIHCLPFHKVCDPVSNWSLVIEFHVVLLVTCCTILLHIMSAFAGDCASDWSLAIDFNTNVLVTCMVA